MSGELKKLRIVAYNDASFQHEVPQGAYTVQVNPEKYSFHYLVKHNSDQAPGTSATQLRFYCIRPEELAFEFIFDGTGVIPTDPVDPGSVGLSPADGVIGQIERFKSVVLDYDGEIHQPRHLKLSWGTLLFKGRLTELTLDFKMFRADGTPIRAVATAKFQGFVEDTLRVARENAQSRDVLHVRTVSEGDNLPYLAYRIYGDAALYLEVARANSLISFRSLPVGASLQFPPVTKGV